MGITLTVSCIHKTEEDLFVVSFPEGTEVPFRLPSIKRAQKYSMLFSIADTVELKSVLIEEIFKECVEDDYLANYANNIAAGIPESVVNVILFLSGQGESFFNYTNELLDLYRPQTKSFIDTMKRWICTAFNSYKMSDLDYLNYQELVYVFTQAEQALIENRIIEERFKLIDPSKQKEEKPKSYTVEDALKQEMKNFENFDSNKINEKQKKEHNLRERLIEDAKRREQEFKAKMTKHIKNG